MKTHMHSPYSDPIICHDCGLQSSSTASTCGCRPGEQGWRWDIPDELAVSGVHPDAAYLRNAKTAMRAGYRITLDGDAQIVRFSPDQAIPRPAVKLH